MAVGADPEFAPCGRCDCIAGVSPIPRKFEIRGVLVTSTCPRRLMVKDAPEIARLYAAYRIGHLLHAGGVWDQPAAYIETMHLISVWSEHLTART